MRFKLSAKPFFAGLLAGLFILAIAGAKLRPTHLVHDFKRVHAGMNFRNFYLTGREIKSIIDDAGNGKIVVVVGGTSVLQGTCQEQNRVWTRYLQEQLGDGFLVMNLALRAGGPADLGNLAAEMLLKENRPVIYLSDAMVSGQVNPLESSFYTQIFSDAWRRGYLLPWEPRDRLMNRALWSSSSSLREAGWGALIDRYLNFKDLWNYFHFEYAGTIWNPMYNLTSFVPVRDVEDPEPSEGWYKELGAPKGEVDKKALESMRAQIIPLEDPRWNTIKSNSEEQIPPALRKISISVVHMNSPYYFSRLSESEKRDFQLQAQHMAELLKGIGFSKTFIAERDFDNADFIDRVHLSVGGGKKLATIMAPQVKETARELGYLK